MGNNDPYSGNDPGQGFQRISFYKFDINKNFDKWKPWRTNDGRILPDGQSSFVSIDNPFGNDNLIKLTTYFDPDLTKRAFGGFGMRTPIDTAVSVNTQTFIEFDFYYSKAAADKYMRFEIWSTSSGGEGIQSNSGGIGTNKTAVYIRTEDLEGVNRFNLDYRCGFYKNETWYKKTICAAVPVSDGNWEYLNIDLHTETDTKVSGGILMIGNIRITKMDPDGVPIPDVVNAKSFNEVEPVKKKYNPANRYFLTGTDGAGKIAPDTVGGYHFELFVSHRNLKPERHIKPPKWLREKFPEFQFILSDTGSQWDNPIYTNEDGVEWDLPTDYYLNIIKAGEYKLHGHCLAWNNQAPPWMCQLIPENISSIERNSSGLFYTYGYNAVKPFLKINKEIMRRIYYNHILYEMRHFMSIDARYNSSAERGIIPFHSFDVVNADVHESQHSCLIINNPNEWKIALKNVSWLMAMTDNDINDIRQHYIYLLYKYAHIAVPNAKMAEKYKKYFNDSAVIPEYMKMDNHDNNGSIDAFISEKPPLLIYNDYEFTASSKVKIIYNMINELNTEWKTDPLYDERNLIECAGIQGHDTVSPVLASQNMQAISLFTSLIDKGLLNYICYSEIDIKMPESAPGGKAAAPDVLNQKQADVIGYQYALLFKMFEKNKKYIDHVILWNQSGSGWQNSYVLFDHEKMASQAYYAVMDPDKFIKGHSYLDKYFSGEYEKIKL